MVKTSEFDKASRLTWHSWHAIVVRMTCRLMLFVHLKPCLQPCRLHLSLCTSTQHVRTQNTPSLCVSLPEQRRVCNSLSLFLCVQHTRTVLSPVSSVLLHTHTPSASRNQVALPPPHTHCCPYLDSLQIPYHVEVVRSCTDNDSIGALVCKRAQQLNVAVLLMAKHNRGAVKEFFLGSVSNYALHHCKQPVLVLHCD